MAGVAPKESRLELLRLNWQSLPRARFVPAALWSGHSRIFIENPAVAGWSFSVGPDSSSGKPDKIVTVEELFREPGFDETDVLKMHIEGTQVELFREACQVYLPRLRLVVIGLHDRRIPGCSRALDSVIVNLPFQQEVLGENGAIRFDPK